MVFFFLFFEPSFAGPGGAVAKAFFKTRWGKVILGILFVIFFPFIAYNAIVEFKEVKRNKKILKEISLKNRDFSWLNLEKNFSNIITRVYDAWGKGDMSLVQNYVNSWYWQNQQLVHLDKWEDENLKNICKLKNVSKIKPLYLELSEEENFEGSKIVIMFSGDIEDYLIDRDSKKVVEGKKGFNNESHIWTMELTEGKWLLDNIHDDSCSLYFLKMENVIPDNDFVSI